MRGSNRPGCRAAVTLAGAVTVAVLAAGCGIRTTSVPVDAGAAPSQVPCSMSAADVAPQTLQGVPVQIYLVCSSQLVTVDRTIQVDEAKADRVRIAQALLDELEQKPPADERQAGFSTTVPATLQVSAARGGDPRGTLRLSEQPEDLPPRRWRRSCARTRRAGRSPRTAGWCWAGRGATGRTDICAPRRRRPDRRRYRRRGP